MEEFLKGQLKVLWPKFVGALAALGVVFVLFAMHGKTNQFWSDLKVTLHR